MKEHKVGASQGSKKRLSLQVSSGRDMKEHKVGASQGSKKRLSPEIYAEVKRRKKENDRLRKEWPRIFANDLGKTSSLSNDSDRTSLFMGDVQSLLFFSLLGMKSPAIPRWVSFVNITKVSHVVMIHVEGMGLSDMKQNTHPFSEGSTSCTVTNSCENEARDHYGANSAMGDRQNVTGGTGVDADNADKSVSSSGGLPGWLKKILPRTSHHMNHAVEIAAPSIHGVCPVEELLQMKSEIVKRGVIEEDIKNFAKEDSKIKKLRASESFFKYLSATHPSSGELHPNDKFSRLKLLLSPGDFAKNNFPLPLPGYKANSDKEFVLTCDNYKQVTSHSPMFGLDCEMCMTSIQKLELTSISIVNERLEVVYHTLVLPYNKVTNFLTKFSGITPAMLKDVTKRLEDVQEDLRKLLPPDAILVGHSLESDFSAMKMMHPYVIDSSLAYNLTGQRNKRSSLKDLSKFFLKEKIQMAGVGGHDPTEDATAALKLMQLKLKNDEAFGNVMMGWEPNSASVNDMEKVLPDTQGHQQQKPEEDCNQDKKEQQPHLNGNTSSDEAIGPFNRKDINIFQKMESCNIAMVTTAQSLKSYLGILASLNKMPTVEVFSGNKQASQRTTEIVANSDLTYVHLEMGKKLSQCPDEATHQRQMTKLDKRLQRIYEASAPKSIHIYVFSGSSLQVPFRERSNGFLLVGIKDLPFRT